MVTEELLVESMKILNIPGKFLRFTHMTIKDSNKLIVTSEGVSEEVHISSGVRQGNFL